MTYIEALEYIHNTLKFGSKPGLMRMSAMLERMGNPHKKVKFVHIAGTNGKGSTTAMTASVLRKAGYKVGMFTSPFVEDFRERIQVDGRYITENELCEQLEKLIPAIEYVKELGFTHPLEFEIITMLAFDFFAEQKCDIVALEVGMGGRFDCTNVIDVPEAAIITSISLDHTKILGNSVEQIAEQKCGIIKAGGAAVCYGMQNPKAIDVIRQHCAKVEASLYIPHEEKLLVKKADLSGTEICYNGLDVHIPLIGEHQIQNALSVIEAIGILRSRGYNITDKNIADGIESVSFPGRMEVVSTKPISIVDGGHNPDGIRALCATIDSMLAGRRLITVMTMFSDKEYKVCIPEVARRSDIFIASQCDYHRALAAYEVACTAKGFCKEIYWNESVNTAVKIARRLAGEDDVILVCGSLYTIHDAKLALAENI